MKSTIEPTVLGLGDQIFGNSAMNIPQKSEQGHDHSCDAESDSSSEDSLITAMTSVKLSDSFWAAAPSYPALYLSTVPEYIPQPSKTKVSTSLDDSVEVDDQPKKDVTWASETYENSVEIDTVFDRFIKRVGFMGEQCFRWVTTGGLMG